jgi:hypothetical protein
MGEHVDVRADGSTKIIYFACHPCTLELRAGDDLQCVTWVDRSQVPACFDQRVIDMLSPEVLAWLQG